MATDRELRDATDVAYVDLTDGFETLISEGRKPPFTIREIVEASNPDSGVSLDQFKDIDPTYLDSWRITAIHDTNDKNGFYGCVIDTGSEFIVSFRGSESMGELSNAKNDWKDADLRLVNATQTKQQAEVERFMKEIAASDYVNKYDSMALAGHSLGGNNALHGAIIASYLGLDINISRAASFDGPGYSDEYIEKYREHIAAMADKMQHYQWSVVGNILQKLPGVEFLTLKVKEKDDFVYNIGGKHSTSSLVWNGETVVLGEMDGFANFIGYFTRGLDHLPKPVGDTMVAVTGTLLISAIWMKDKMFDKNGNLNAFGWSVVVGAVSIVAIVGVVPTIAIVGTVLLAALTLVAAIAALEYIYEGLVQLAEMACELLGKAWDWTTEKMGQLRDFVMSSLQKAGNWFRNTFNPGHRYASAHPYIKLDTYKLRNYADRLRSINRRLNSLDRRMDSLYRYTNLIDFFTLFQADLMTGESWRINQCISYLEETADNFEKAERNIVSNMP